MASKKRNWSDIAGITLLLTLTITVCPNYCRALSLPTDSVESSTGSGFKPSLRSVNLQLPAEAPAENKIIAPVNARPRFITFATTPTTTTIEPSSEDYEKKLICHYNNQAATRPDKGRLLIENIEPTLCTHIIYGSLSFNDRNQIDSILPEIDFDDTGHLGSLRKLLELKRLNPQLKIIASVGGVKVKSQAFSEMAAAAKTRSQFVNSVIEFLNRFQLNGVEIDWQFPGSLGGSECDKKNYVNLLRDLKAATEANGFLLASQVAAAEPLILSGFNIPLVSKYLDLIILMAYDYHEVRETKTGVLAPLYETRRYNLTSKSEAKSNVNWTVNHWLDSGAPARKLILGVTYYGQTFTLDRGSVNGINAPAKEPGMEGPYTQNAGIIGYNEFCITTLERPSAWTVVQDYGFMVPYAFNGILWTSYEDRESLSYKTQYAMSKNLGGLAVNSIDVDDFLGRCHHIRFPLTRAIKAELSTALMMRGESPGTSKFEGTSNLQSEEDLSRKFSDHQEKDSKRQNHWHT